MRVPCMKCEEREVGCHADCERYAEFRKIIDELNKKRADSALVNAYENKRVTALIRTRHIKKNGRSG